MSLSASSHYANIFSLSSVTQCAWLRDDCITTIRSVRDIEENSNRVLLEVYPNSAGSGKNSLLKPITSVELSPFALMDISPSGKSTITIINKDDKVFFTLASKDGGVSLKMEASSSHGKVIGDSWLGGCSWSSDEKYFAYVAKEKESEVKSSFEKPAEETRNIFDYKEDWGEKYDGISRLCLCILDTTTGKVTVVPGINSEQLTVGQPVFRPMPTTNLEGSVATTYSLIYTGWSTSPRRLGMIYCYQRPAHLYLADVTALLTEKETAATVMHINLTPDVYVSRSPRFSPTGDSLLFMGSLTKVASHNSCFQLLSISIDDTFSPSSLSVLIDKVRKPASYPHDFPGLFCDQLPKNCFLSPEELLITTQWGSSETVIKLHIPSKKITRMSSIILGVTPTLQPSEWNDPSQSACAVLDIHSGRVVFSTSSPVNPQRIGLHDFSSSHTLTSSTPIIGITRKSPPCKSPFDLLSELHWKMIPFKDSASVPYDCLLVTPQHIDSITSPLPMLVVIHGGPHAVSPSSFISSYAYLSTLLHASILYVNYRGSIGFGLDSINSLLGNIGEQDVKDVVTSIDHAKRITSASGVSLVDADKLAIIGGSHGGFLSTHLIGQFPSLFKVAIVRNPVTNIPAMLSTSDIPDWCHIEGKGEEDYDFSTFKVPSAEDLAVAYTKSPIRYIENVLTPVLLCLGGKDRRVPSSQGIEYHHALLSKGAECKMLFFPEDSHALDKPSTEFEQWYTAADYIKKKLE